MFKTTALDSVANRYVDEDIPTSTPGTRLEAADKNIEMDELVNAVEGSGLTLDPTGVDRDQLLEAITRLGGLLTVEGDLVVRGATIPERLAAVAAGHVLKSAGIGAKPIWDVPITSKNAIINGAMLHAQRGASGSAAFDSTTTPANNDDTYLVDRYLNLSDGNDIVDISQSTDAPAGGLLSYSMDVETINKKFGLLQIIEQKNCQHMIGGNVSLSFEARVTDITKLDNIKAMIVSWDGTADAPTSDIISAWGAEDTTPTLVANWTAENTPADLGVTASWAKYKIENVAIDTASTKNIGVFIWSDGFCDTLGKILRITNVQLEKNSIATEFDWQDDLSFCQKYCCKSYDQNIVPGTATVIGRAMIRMTGLASSDHEVTLQKGFKILMRVTPTVTVYDEVGNSGKVSMEAGDNIATTGVNISINGIDVTAINGAASTARRISYHYIAYAEIGV